MDSHDDNDNENSKPKKRKNDIDLNITQNQKRTRYEDVDAGSSSKDHDTIDRIYKRTHEEKHSKSKKRQSETVTESSTDLNVTQGKQRNFHHEDFTEDVGISSTHQDITDSQVNKPQIDLNTESSLFQMNNTQNKQFINKTDYEVIMKILSRLKTKGHKNDPNPKSPVHDSELVKEDKNNKDETAKDLLKITKEFFELYDEHSVNKDVKNKNVLKEGNVISPNSFPHHDKKELKKLPKGSFERIIDDFPVREKVSNQVTLGDKYILDTHYGDVISEQEKKSKGRPRKRKLEIDETYSKNSNLRKQKVFHSKITKSKKTNLDKSPKLAVQSEKHNFISRFLEDVDTTNSSRLHKTNTLIEPRDTDKYNSMARDVISSYFPMKDDTVHRKKKSAYHKSNWFDDKELHDTSVNEEDKTIKNKIFEKSKSRKFTPTKSVSSKVSSLPDLFIKKSVKIKDSPLFNSDSLSNLSASPVQKEVNNKGIHEKTDDSLKNDYTYDIEVRNTDNDSNGTINSSEPLAKLRKLGKPALKSSINLDVFKDNVNNKTRETSVDITRQIENESVEGSSAVTGLNSKIKILQNICLCPPTATINELFSEVQDNISTASISKVQGQFTQQLSNDFIQSWICTGHPESYFPICLLKELLSFFEDSIHIVLENLKGPIPAHLIKLVETFDELAEVLHKRPSTK